jgi:multiple sugar transport system substrate-binding protein
MISDRFCSRFTRRQLLQVGGGAVATTAVASILAACGGNAPASLTAAPAAPTATTVIAAAVAPGQSTGPVNLTVAAGWTTTGWKAVWDLLLKGYQDKFPNITVALDQSSATGQYDQKLLAEIAAGTLPDVVYTSDNYVAPFKQNKITQDMLPFAKTTNFPIDDFNKTFLNLGMVQGTLQMLPVSGDVVVLMVNKKMVAEAGVTIPWTLDPKSTQWTYDDFVKVCQRLTVDGNGKRGDEAGFDKTNISVYGAAIDPTWWAVYVPAILAEGGQFVSDDLTKSLFNSREGVAAITKLTKPVLDGYWAPLSVINTDSSPFPAGKAAIFDTVRGGIPTFRNEMKDDWDVVHFYMGSHKRVTGMGTQGFALSGSSKLANDAWNFLSYMYSEDGMRIITSQYGAVPVEQRFYNAAWWKNLPPPPANNDVFTQAFDYGTLPPRLPFYTTGPFTKAITDGFTGIELKLTTPDKVATSVSDALQKWLDLNKPQAQ